MIRLGTLFWLVLVSATGFATFGSNTRFRHRGRTRTSVRRQTIAEQQEIRVLDAEWAYLNQPSAWPS